jgi:GTP:adenosylcobinamide-phosphate guanylyltransferase
VNAPLLILAGGKSSRMAEYCQGFNKALLPLAGKAVISHLIEKTTGPIVVSLGHGAEQVQEYCLAAHPEREFQFVHSEGGTLAAVLAARPSLSRPFYLLNCDTLIEEELPALDCDWIGVAPHSTRRTYVTVSVTDTGRLEQLWNKGEHDEGFAYIGLAGIVSWERFFEDLEEEGTWFGHTEYVIAWHQYLRSGLPIQAHSFTWHDTGSPAAWREARRAYADFSLGMPKSIEERTYHVGDRLIKVVSGEIINRNRLSRWNALREFTAPLRYTGKYTAAWDWIPGQPLYEAPLETQLRFFDWCDTVFWQPQPESVVWDERCRLMYEVKTWERVRQYQERDRADLQEVNHHPVDLVENLLARVPWHELQQGIPVRFHGDLQFDNVIYGEDARYYLIDWRSHFGGSPRYGDLYYELAKLYGGLVVSYSDLKRGDFGYWNGISDGPEDGHVLVEWNWGATQPALIVFTAWVESRGWDLPRIRLLAALIHLNMAPLHPGDLGDFLWALGSAALQTQLERMGR